MTRIDLFNIILEELEVHEGNTDLEEVTDGIVERLLEEGIFDTDTIEEGVGPIYHEKFYGDDEND
jgi:hypothetical protein